MKDNFIFHHIGIATLNIKESISLYKRLGYKLLNNDIVKDSNQNVELAFMKKMNHPLIELVHPVNESSPVASILKKMRTTPYHTCYEISGINEKIKELNKIGFLLVMKPTPAVAFENRKIAFLYHKSFGIIELLDKK